MSEWLFPKKEKRNIDINYKYKKGNLYYDKVEKTLAYQKCVKQAEELARQMADEKTNGFRGMGYCHIFWGCKKQVLKDNYNIDWRSPAEMNPYCKFD